MGANSENYGSFCSLFFGVPSPHGGGNIRHEKKVTILVKRQLLPDRGKDKLSS